MLVSVSCGSTYAPLHAEPRPTRMFLGHLAHRFGGANVALVSVLVEALGLGLIERAPGLALGLTGAALTGLGYSLVYPGLGVEAVRRVPADSRGLAMGAYTAFLDVALGLSTPALGLLASAAGFGAVFLASAVASLCAASIAASFLLSAPARPHLRDFGNAGEQSVFSERRSI